jgi:antitoxin CptB
MSDERTLDEAEEIEFRRLRWRCRRGMRELDQLFGRYLDREWKQASEAERGVFLQLLDCEDDKLWRWFMGYEQCPDDALASLIQRIRQLPA